MTAENQRPTRTGTQNLPIYNGLPDTAPEHRAVVALTYGPGTDYFCSGTLVTQRVVLTAAHCVQGVQATAIEIFFGNNVNGPGDFRPVIDKLPHSSYNPGQLTDDIALLQLGSDAPLNVTPIRHLPATLELTAADVGTDLDHSGFGYDENLNDGVKLHLLVPIALVCPGPSGCTYAGASVNPRAFAYSMNLGGPCMGDSGGPAFIFRGNCEYVAGITSYGDAGCLDYGVDTKVDAHQSWIDGYIAAAGVEDCSTGGDEDNDGLADCNDPDCACDPACQGTSELCTNGIDDDGDGLTDCADPNCAPDPACQLQPDGGVTQTDGAPTDPDGSQPLPDGAPVNPDGSVPVGDGSPPGTDGSTTGTSEKGGCSCRSGPHTSPSFLFLLVVLVVLKKRRR